MFGEASHTTSDVDEAAWKYHLSTLFPEVRPKGYYEVRCIDAQPPEHLAAPILIIAALLWDAELLSDAAKLLPAADEAMLSRAARDGLADVQLRELAIELVARAHAACKRLGPEFASDQDAEALRTCVDRSVTAGGTSLENNFIGNDHVSDDAVARLGE
jgi:glutamate--cysteine ligase